jgi:hypothetical protein
VRELIAVPSEAMRVLDGSTASRVALLTGPSREDTGVAAKLLDAD